MPASHAKRHHFVPQLLLRQFCRTGDARLFQLDVRSGRPIRVSVREAASRRSYYQFEDEEGRKTNAVEAYFALIESHAGPLLKRLADEGVVSDPERATLSLFFALLGMRTPSGRRAGETIAKASFEYLVGSYCGDPETFARMYREWRDEDVSAAEAEDFRLRTLEMVKSGGLRLVDSDGGATMRTLLEVSAQTTLAIFGEMTWTLLRSDGSEFVTSDRGLAIFDPTPRFPWSTDAILSSDNVQTNIPLSSNYSLVLTPGEPTIRAITADPVDVMRLNLRTYGWADNYVFGSSQKVVTDVRRATRKSPKLVVKPRPFRHVTLVEANPLDTRLADEHRRRGWPAYLTTRDEGGTLREFDYMVMGEEDASPIEVGVATTKMAKAQALRKMDLAVAPDPEVR